MALNFPSSPALNDIYNNYKWDGSVWRNIFAIEQGPAGPTGPQGPAGPPGSNVDATETVKGIVELATIAEATAGTDTVRAVTPAGLAAAMLAGGGGLGYGQTWQDMTASRLSNTVYTNTTGKPIVVTVEVTHAGGGIYLSCPGNSIGDYSQRIGFAQAGLYADSMGIAIIPVGATYSGYGSIARWWELR